MIWQLLLAIAKLARMLPGKMQIMFIIESRF